MSTSAEIRLARSPYNWLRVSPLLTIPTLVFIALFGGDFFSGLLFGALGSSLWHLIFLLQYVYNNKSDLVQKHGRQALVYAGIRTGLVLSFGGLSMMANNEGLALWALPILIFLWVVNSQKGYTELNLEAKNLAEDQNPPRVNETTESAMPESDPRRHEEPLDEIPGGLQTNAKSQGAATPVEIIQFESDNPRDVLNAILEGLQSDLPPKRLGAIYELHKIQFSSAAIREKLESLSIRDPLDEIRREALIALDLPSHRFIRTHANKVERGNRYLLLQEIRDWEDLGLIEKHRADILRRRYDFDFTPPPEPRPVIQAQGTPAPAPKEDSAPIKSAPPAQVETTSTRVEAEPAPIIAKPAPKPSAPPKPKQPPIDWKKVRQQAIDAAASGALLRALLYLGAFMIVISATVLVVRFWSAFNPVLQLLFIASVPLIFYAGGWTLRMRLKLAQAGTVLTGIGAVLVAVDFAAIYQFGGLAQQVNGPAYWLGVAVFCTLLYAFTSWKLQGEFFDYLTLIAAASAIFAWSRIAKAPIEWGVVSVTFSAAIMSGVAAFLKSGNDHGVGRAARLLSQVLIPASIVFILYSKADVPIMSAFLLAVMAYGIFAWKFPGLVFAYSALGASVGMVLFGLRAFDVSPQWDAGVAAALALIYIFIGQLARRTKTESNIYQSYTKAFNLTGFLLIGLSVADGFYVAAGGETWAGVMALTTAALDLAACAYLFRGPRYTLLAAGLFIVPFTFAALRLSNDAQTAQAITWLAVCWGVLAVVYIALAAFLRKAGDHARWVYMWAHGLLPAAALCTLPDYLFTKDWVNTTALVSLGVCVAGYLITFILQDSGKHSSLSAVSNWLPLGAGKALFLWPIGFLLPVLAAVAWHGTDLATEWFGAALGGLAVAYLGAGQTLGRRAREYRLPFHGFVYLLCSAAIPISFAGKNALLASLLLTVLSAGVLAYLYNRVLETVIASFLLAWPFQLSLEIFKIPPYSQGLAYILFSGLVYIPVGVYLNRAAQSRERYHPIPVFIAGYAWAGYAVAASLAGRTSATFVPWVGAAIPLIASALFAYSASYFNENKFAPGWAWASALAFAIAFGQGLTLFNVPAGYLTTAWAGLPFVYLFLERAFESGRQRIKPCWSQLFRWPLVTGATLLALLGLALSLPATFKAFSGLPLTNYHAPIIAQGLLVALLIVAAGLYKQPGILFVEPLLALLPVTLFFVGYGETMFNHPLSTSQFALVWAGLGIAHWLAGIFLDRSKIRHAYGIYLGAYTLLTWAVLWSANDRALLVWSLGLWLLALAGSAVLVHFARHRTWIEFHLLVFGKSTGPVQTAGYNAFQWLAEWIFPIWLVLALLQINIPADLAWLGFILPPLAYIGLALWFQRVDAAYTVPLHTASQFYAALVVFISIPFTTDHLAGNFALTESRTRLFAFIALQTLAVVFYSAASWRLKQRRFAHVAGWLSFFPYTLAWIAFDPTYATYKFALPWLGWATILLLIGFALDNNKTRYSQAPYLAGYFLAIVALAFSALDRSTNIYALAWIILLGVGSHWLVHFGRHHAFEDFIRRFWRTPGAPQQVASTAFLFFAAFASPVLLAQILAHLKLDLTVRGALLATAAPLFIAIGLAVRNTRPRSLELVTTWPLYSAGYALSAIGAMVAFGDEQLAIYALILDAIVYAISAYIFRQAFWLYLSTALAPFIALLILYKTGHLQSSWAAWIFIGLAYLYFAFGQALDRSKGNDDEIHPFAASFYAPGFILSAVALALASSDKMLALQIYSLGVVLYALAAWRVREALFLYPAAWLATVPYFLAVTLTPLATRWYGLAWLPLILLYIGLGRFVFHKEALPPLGQGMLAGWLSHPAVPFYLLAYSLSVSMISLSYVSPLSLMLAFGAAAVIYLTSSYLFNTPGWIYAGLFATHMTVMAYFTINPSGGPVHYITLPFLAMTWLTALFGYGVSRRITGTGSGSKEEAFKFSLTQRLFGHAWARPFFTFAIIEMFIWQGVAIKGYDTTIITAGGYALLLALFSLLWSEGVLVYGVAGFGLLAAGAWMKQAGIAFTEAVAIYGGLGFGLYLLARIFEPLSTRAKPLAVWLLPLTRTAIALTAVSVIVNLPFVGRHMTASAASLAFAGALYVALAYRGRIYQLGYVGMALLEAAWAMALYMSDVSQPQWYAIPGGLYFMGLAYLEWQRNKSKYAIGLEILGMGILLVTSFTQSLNGDRGFPYFVILMIEALLLLGWGTVQKRKLPFFSGVGFTALNFIAQVILLVNVGLINIWYVGLGVGLLIVGIAVFVELRREQLRARIGEWTEALEQWE